MRVFAWLILCWLFCGLAFAGVGTITTKDAGGTTRTFVVVTDGSGNFNATAVICDQSAAATCASVGAAGSPSTNALTVQPVTLGSGTATNAARVELANNGTGVIATVGAVTAITNALPVGSNVIGHVIVDTTSTTAVTQATASNLNATVVGTGTFATQAAQSGAWNITNVSGTVSLPTGAATSALQPTAAAQGSTTSGQTGHLVQCAATTSAPTYTTAQTNPLSCDTAGNIRVVLNAETSKVIGTVNQGTSPWVISGALTANQSVNLAQVAGTNTINGGVAGSQSVGGTVATNVAITANPLNIGAQAVSSENAAVTTARQVQLVSDLVGKLIVLPYSNPENFVSGATAAMTGTTSTSLIAAPASGLRNYVTQLICTNSHATVGTFVLVQDGSGGTTFYEAYAAAVGGGFALSFPTPLRQPTTATALFVQDVTTGANVICSGSGYKGA